MRRQIDIDLDGNMEVAGAHMVHFRTNDRELFQGRGPTWHYQNGRGTIIAQNDDDIYTLQAWLIPGLDIDKMASEDLLEGWVGRKFDYEILQANSWAANFVVAERYRTRVADHRRDQASVDCDRHGDVRAAKAMQFVATELDIRVGDSRQRAGQRLDEEIVHRQLYAARGK